MRFSLLETIFGIAAIVLLILLAVCGWNGRRLNAQVDKYQVAVASFESTQKTNLETIEGLLATNADWAEKCRVDPGEQSAALAEVTAERDRLEDALEHARNNREVIYAEDPNAREWADSGIPADVADGLWPPAD